MNPSQIAPLTFSRIASFLCGLWLLVVLPVLNWCFWEKLPESIRSGHGDFEQYYSGALVVRYGLWDQLYPVPKPNYWKMRYLSLFKVPLFAKDAKRRSYLAMQIAAARASDVGPKLLAYCPSLADHCRYIYPPPLALYLSPLSYFSYETARKIWFELMCAALFGSAWLSSRITRMIWGRVSYAEGSLFLLVLVWTLLRNEESTILACGNVSPLLGFLIALTAYAWVRGREGIVGIAMVFLIPFKGIGLNWCPFLLLKPIKTKALAVMAGVTVVLNGITLYVGGVEPYRRFFSEILPVANIAVGFGLQRRTLVSFGDSYQKVYLAIQLALLGLIYWGYWRNRNSPDRSRCTIAMFAGTAALFCEFNPVVWAHYLPHYLLIPFFGWLVWEVNHYSSRLIRNLMWALLLANLFLIAQNPVLSIEAPAFGALKRFVAGINFDLVVIQPVFVLILVFKRLFFEERSRSVGESHLFQRSSIERPIF